MKRTLTYNHHRTATLFTNIAAACIALGCSSERPTSSPEESPSASRDAAERFDLSLPPVKRQLVQLLKEPTRAANARVLLEFDLEAPSKQLPFYPYVLAGPEKNPLILRDDGLGGDDKAEDGSFSALVLVDTTALRARVEAERKAAQTPKEVPRFDGRQVVRFERPRALDVSVLDGAISEFFPFDFFIPRPEDAEKAIAVTDTSVVRDPTRTYDPCTDSGNGNGPWSFGHLMSQIAAPAGIPTSMFVEQWLERWLTPQVANTFTAPARLLVQNLIDDWRTASGGGDLDVARAPFRLLAIMNRTDTGTVAGSIGGLYGGSDLEFDGRGELRFVFGLVIPPSYAFKSYNSASGATNDGGCLLQPFTVIFEYSILRDTCSEIKPYNQQWIDLESKTFGVDYNAALQAITDPITVANAAPGRPNNSAISQIRTNDFTFGQAPAFPYEMREFRVPAPMGFLEQVVVADTADLVHDGEAWTGDYIHDEGGKPPTLLFPSTYGATPQNALAAAAPVPDSGFHWTGSGVLNPGGNPADRDARHEFSLAACNGCHARETDTAFVHIENRTPTAASPATLSGFLTGITVADPVVMGFSRMFGDIDRRQERQVDIANASCSAGPIFDFGSIRERLIARKPLPDDPFKGVEQPPLDRRVTIPLESFTMQAVTQVH